MSDNRQKSDLKPNCAEEQIMAGKPYLDTYELDLETRWCWRRHHAGSLWLVSQDFESEDDAVEAWSNDLLVWEPPPSID